MSSYVLSVMLIGAIKVFLECTYIVLATFIQHLNEIFQEKKIMSISVYQFDSAARHYLEFTQKYSIIGLSLLSPWILQICNPDIFVIEYNFVIVYHYVGNCYLNCAELV